jgi:LysM repeat protein
MYQRRAAVGALALSLLASGAEAQSLVGSKTTMIRQNLVAREHDYTFLRNAAHVRKFVDLGLLVRVRGNANYELASVSYPYARPELQTFIERLAAQYRSACGEKLVVTSLTRPLNEQPRNASDLSVHPTGMAVDLRISNRAKCRTWLERTLISLEKQGVLDAIRERRPPHYHVAVFPSQYASYVARITGGTVRLASGGAAPARTAEAPADATATVAAEASESAGEAGDNGEDASAEDARDAALLETADLSPGGAGESTAEASSMLRYRVTRGETLWSIARRHGITVDALKQQNGLRASRIDPGQVLAIPVAR